MKFTILTILTLLLGLSGSVVAQDVRIGFMDPQYVLDNLPEKEEVEAQLDDYLDQREQEFQEEAIEYQTLLGEYQEEAENLSDSQNQQRQQQLQAMEQELEQLQMQIERDFEQRRNELIQPILNDMNDHIAALADDKNLDYVLNESTGQGELILIHVSDQGRSEFELTDQVLERMLNTN